MYNKRQFYKANDKKNLHKIGKHWVVVSAFTLALLLGAGTTVQATSNQKAKADDNNDHGHAADNNAKLQNQANQQKAQQFSNVANKPSATPMQNQEAKLHKAMVSNVNLPNFKAKPSQSSSTWTEAAANHMHARLLLNSTNNGASQTKTPTPTTNKTPASAKASTNTNSSLASSSASSVNVSSKFASPTSNHSNTNKTPALTSVPPKDTHVGLGAMPPENLLKSTPEKTYTFPNGQTTEEQTLKPTRTIIYQNDNGQSLAKSAVQQLVAKRTAQIDKNTGKVTYGTWQFQGSNTWPAVTSPTATDLKNAGVPGYGNPSSAVVPSEQPDSNLSNKIVTVQYSGDETEATQSATISRTISYDDETVQSKSVAKPVTQSITFHRIVTINEDGGLNYSPWVSDNGTKWTPNYEFPAVTSPSADQLNNTYHEKGYGAPGKAIIPAMKVNPAFPLHLGYKVTYPETVKKKMVYKTILRKIEYNIERDGKYYYYKNGQYVLSNIQRRPDGEYYYGKSDGTYPYFILQPVQYTRVAYINQVTGQTSYGSWNSVAGTGKWNAVNSSDIMGSDYSPTNNTVDTAQASPNMSDVPVDVSYGDKWAPFYNKIPYTRQIQYVDKDNPNKVLVSSDNETASNLQSGTYDVNGGQQQAGWSIEGSFRNVKSPDLSREGYDAPTITDVSSDDAGYSSDYDHGQDSGTITVEYPEHINKHTNSKTVTRTINYVSDHDPSKHVAPTVTQPVTLSQTTSTNAVTHKTTTSDWKVTSNKKQWSDVKSPNLSAKGYDTPTITDEPKVVPNQNTQNVNITVKYPDKLNITTKTRIIKRVINYVDANNPSQAVATPVTQEVVYTQPVVKDGITGETTNGSWQVQGSNKWSDAKSPDLSAAGYQAPDKQDVPETSTNSNTQSTSVTVKYPEQVSTSTDTRVIDRTINYVDKSNPSKLIAPSVVQPVTYTRQVSTNDVTGQVSYGSWSAKGTNQWGTQQSPDLTDEGYGNPDRSSVNELNTSANTSDTSVNVTYPEKSNPSTDTKTIQRTINYVDADNINQHVATTITQPVKYTRSVSTNAITGKTTYGPWKVQGNDKWPAQESPDLSANGFDAPETTSVSDVTTNGNTPSTTVTVEYPEHESLTTDSRTIDRKITYVDKNNPSKQIATPVNQYITYTRPVMTNAITGNVTYGTWQPNNNGQWPSQESPDLTANGYMSPDKQTVNSVTTTPQTTNANITVSYPENIEHSTDTKTINRTIKYVDADNPSKQIAKSVVQPVQYNRSVSDDKATGKVTYGNWQPVNGAQWQNQTSPNLSTKGYSQPNYTTVNSANTSSDTSDTTVLVKYPEKINTATIQKTINRTIAYVDANDPTKHIAKTVVQPVTYKQTVKTNAVSGAVSRSDWTPQGTARWGEQVSPDLTDKGYGSPSQANVSEMTTSADTPNTNITIKYPERTNQTSGTKTIERTINYVRKNNPSQHVAPTIKQPITYNRSVTTNDVTGKVIYGNWQPSGTNQWSDQVSPDLSKFGYETPTITKVDSIVTNPNTSNSNITVEYPDHLTTSTDTKTITRTINYVDANDPAKHIAKTESQPVTYTRTAILDHATSNITYSQWQPKGTSQWPGVTSPNLSAKGYNTPYVQGSNPQVRNVSAQQTTSDTGHVNVTVKYPEGTKSVSTNPSDSEILTRTIKYEDASNHNSIATAVKQPITYIRTTTENAITGQKLGHGTWQPKSGNGHWSSITSPNLSAKGYNTPDKVNVSDELANGNPTVIVNYPEGNNTVANDPSDSKTITRTISYVDASNHNKHVSNTVTQPVTYTRTTTKNAITGKTLSHGNWQANGTNQWSDVTSPTPAQLSDNDYNGYDNPSRASVSDVTTTPSSHNQDIVITYPEHLNQTQDTKTIQRIINYVDANNPSQNVATSVVQPVTYTRTTTTNEVTGKVTHTNWTTNEQQLWPAKKSPNLNSKGFGGPSQNKVNKVTTSPSTKNDIVTITYPENSNKNSESETIERTINYVSQNDPSNHLAKSVVQPVTYTRTVNINHATGKVTYGDWLPSSSNTWSDQKSPDLSAYGYDTPDQPDIKAAVTNGNTKNANITVKYPDKINHGTDTNTIKRTINYIDADNPTKHVAKSVTQPVTYKRSVTTDEVTGHKTYGNWQLSGTSQWPDQKSPDLRVNGYDAPDQSNVNAATVKSNALNQTINVKYHEHLAKSTDTKTTKRTINYVSANDPAKHLAKTVTQPVTYIRSVTTNKVTGKVTHGAWQPQGTDQWPAQKSPNLSDQGYNIPDKPSVNAVTTNGNTQSTNVNVNYPEGTATVPEKDTVTRTIYYKDAQTGQQLALPVTQKVTYIGDETVNAVTGKATIHWSTKGNPTWNMVASPTTSQLSDMGHKYYQMPSITLVNQQTVNPNDLDQVINVYYPQGQTTVPEINKLTRTIYYEDAQTGQQVAKPVIQVVTFNGKVKVNAVTNKVSSQWTTQNNKWAAQKSPDLSNQGYGKPSIDNVDQESLDPNNGFDSVIVVRYPETTSKASNTKTLNRVIQYQDKKTGKQLAPSKIQSVTYKRTITINKVTGNKSYGSWFVLKGSSNFSSIISPSLSAKGYEAPSKAEVKAVKMSPNTHNASVTVYYEPKPAKPNPKPNKSSAKSASSSASTVQSNHSNSASSANSAAKSNSTSAKASNKPSVKPTHSSSAASSSSAAKPNSASAKASTKSSVQSNHASSANSASSTAKPQSVSSKASTKPSSTSAKASTKSSTQFSSSSTPTSSSSTATSMPSTPTVLPSRVSSSDMTSTRSKVSEVSQSNVTTSKSAQSVSSRATKPTHHTANKTSRSNPVTTLKNNYRHVAKTSKQIIKQINNKSGNAKQRQMIIIHYAKSVTPQQMTYLSVHAPKVYHKILTEQNVLGISHIVSHAKSIRYNVTPQRMAYLKIHNPKLYHNILASQQTLSLKHHNADYSATNHKVSHRDNHKLPQTNEATNHASTWSMVFASISALIAGLGKAIHHKHN